MGATPTLKFELGTLVLEDFDQDLKQKGLHLPELKFDSRTLQWRCPALAYREIVYYFYASKLNLIDKARSYQKLDLSLREKIVPRPHQTEALNAWINARSKGVVSLPTGAGKTILAVLAIAKIQRPTLIVVPTIDLLLQWRDVLTKFFGGKIGVYGGGEKTLEDLTVATYDSAHLMIEAHGHRFGFLIFDECHHLPANRYQLIAKSAIAPFRLGLSATVERPDGKEELTYELLGDMVFEGAISEMVSEVLAPYDVVSVEVPLSDDERLAYHNARELYVGFIRQQRIQLSRPEGWSEFIRKSATVPGGKEAMRAYREQKRISQASDAKISELWRIMNRHRHEQMIIFTNDNALAYRIGEEFFLAVLTHQTKTKERKKMLEAFRGGRINVLVTSKVLNEGVDVPEASVGVVVSGSGTVREHVQRLGRILRHRAGKRAVLYEIISKDTGEFYVNQRRRMHHAYQGPSKVHHTRHSHSS